MKVYAWLIDFAHFRENCPTGIIPEWMQKVTHQNGIKQSVCQTRVNRAFRNLKSIRSNAEKKETKNDDKKPTKTMTLTQEVQENRIAHSWGAGQLEWRHTSILPVELAMRQGNVEIRHMREQIGVLRYPERRVPLLLDGSKAALVVLRQPFPTDAAVLVLIGRACHGDFLVFDRLFRQHLDLEPAGHV